MCGVPISWKSKQQGGVTLISSEAEYYAISEVAMELKFVKMVLDFLEFESEGLMKVLADNIGAIHLANNASSGSRTKHIDTRLHFVRELTQGERKMIEMVLVRSEEKSRRYFHQEYFKRYVLETDIKLYDWRLNRSQHRGRMLEGHGRLWIFQE
jgi:hypothetical protein